MVGDKRHPFVDTNVIFSGLYNPDGTPGILLSLHARGEIRIRLCQFVLNELERTIERRNPDLLQRLAEFREAAPFDIVPDPTPIELEHAMLHINVDDAPILAAAIACRADCIVSGNTRRFTQEVAERAGIPIFTPAAYLLHLQGR